MIAPLILGSMDNRFPNSKVSHQENNEAGASPKPKYEPSDGEDSTVIEDVLPSFEMHNYMFNRTIFDTENIASLEQPPTYDEAPPNTTGDLNRSNSSLFDQNNFVDPTKNPNLLLLNNLDKFQKLDVPLDIQIVLTKSIPKIGSPKPERENPLRQYRPGEVVCGYIIIENKTKEPIPFEMLLVSLEGNMTITNPAKPHELIRKKFLKTYDLSACFHYGCIDLASQNVSENTFIDEFDQTYLGFQKGRRIRTNAKHKKHFAFKLPHFLLDTACFEELPNHLKLPPSFGVDNCAFGGDARDIRVDNLHGYGRLNVYGSPIKTNDYAVYGQSISYLINVQFIGRRLDFYKKFYYKETSHEYDFISLKNVEHYFRIDTSDVSTDILNPLWMSNFGEMPTKEQLKLIENLTTDKLNEILERKNLKQIGIKDRLEQDQIIFSALPTSKKSEPHIPSNSSDLPTNFDLKELKTAFVNDNGFCRQKAITLVRDFFNKVDGDLSVTISMDKNAQIKSLKPKSLRMASKNPKQYNSELQSISSNTNIRTPLTSPQLETATSNMSLDTLINARLDQESMFVSLTFENRKGSKIHLPSTITITPNLQVYNVESPYPIPITFDNQFIFDFGLEEPYLSNLKKKYKFYYQQLVQVLKELETGLARSLYDKINSLAGLKVEKHIVRKIFESHVIDLHNQWKFDETAHKYQCEFQLPLALDMRSPDRLNTLCIPPTFQQCLLCRLYAINLQVSVKKAKNTLEMTFPVSVI